MPRKLPIYQVDAFADAMFGGNPAAVMPLKSWLPEALMQRIAAENNLAETAFLVADKTGYALRWFTPTVEVPLCGHATLAAAHIVFKFLKPRTKSVIFTTREAGILTVARDGEMLALDFPSMPPQPAETPAGLHAALGLVPDDSALEIVMATGNLFCVFRDQASVAALKPDFRLLAALPYFGLIATAPGADGVDFVSRFFAPGAGIDEDPATGSAHCTLIPYWATRLSKNELLAQQISPRIGSFACRDRGDRVTIAGSAQLYMTGIVTLP